MKKIVALVISCISFIILDLIWIKIMQVPFSKMISSIMLPKLHIDYLTLIYTYSLLLIGFIYFIALPYLVHKKPLKYLIASFLLGVIIFGNFESTNAALFPNWKTSIIILDTIWGGVLYFASTIILIFSYKLLKR